MEATAESSLVGQTFDNKFRIIRLVGRGGMGEVFEAEHTELGKRVAVKLMLEKYNGDTEAIARFKREALAASRIGDPHIIDVMDIGTAPDGRAYVVMELLEGQPLSRLINDYGQLPPQRALRIMRQVLRAVGAAHAKGIVHRDLKPDNIFLQHQGEDGGDFIKLLDFGISKIMDPELQAAATKLTTTGVVMGTPLYMAPEQAMGMDIDHHADIYACGVMFYEMLAGRPPFEGNTYAVLVAKLLTTDPPLLSTLREGLPPKMIAATHRALEKDPANRFHSCDQFLAALPSTNSGSAVELAGTLASGAQSVAGVPVIIPTGQNTTAPVAQKSNNAVLIGATLAGIAVATVVIVMMQRGSSTPTPPVQTTKTDKIEAVTKPTVVPITGPTLLQLTVTPAEATITVDRVKYRSGELLTVKPGNHDIHAELAGYVAQSIKVDVAEHTTKDFKLELVAEPAPAKLAPRIDPKKKPPTSSRVTIDKDDNNYVPPRPVDKTMPPKPVAVPIPEGTDRNRKDNPYKVSP